MLVKFIGTFLFGNGTILQGTNIVLLDADRTSRNSHKNQNYLTLKKIVL